MGRRYKNYWHEKNNYSEKPRYLVAATRNNSHRFDWGPKKEENYGKAYCHLKKLLAADDVVHNGSGGSPANTYHNYSFQPDSVGLNGSKDVLQERL